MTDKQIIKLKPMEDLNEKIIKEKGNTKCIFYNDDICRNGDKTRDCVNCARVEYRSLYKLNWDNQDRLFEQLDQLKEDYAELEKRHNDSFEQFKQLKADNDLLRKTHKTEQDRRRAYEQALTEIKEIAEAHKKYIYVLPSYSVAGDSLEFSFEFTKEILQKCEVLDE